MFISKLIAWFRIPRGYYCYGKHRKPCPFWSVDKTKPEQENGYCSYLGRGDWELNEEKRWFTDDDPTLRSGHEIGIPMSLLWDQCKECHIKIDDSFIESIVSRSSGPSMGPNTGISDEDPVNITVPEDLQVCRCEPCTGCPDIAKCRYGDGFLEMYDEHLSSKGIPWDETHTYVEKDGKMVEKHEEH